MNETNVVRHQEEYTGEPDDQTEEEARQALEEKIQIFGAGLQRKFDQQVSRKDEIEQRWLDDMRHYNGRYDKDTEAKMFEGAAKDKKNASRVFVNLTRAKTNIAESKWSDLVLPTDDRNWGIGPTPVPEMADMMEDDDPVELEDGTVAVNPDNENEPYKRSDVAREVMAEARKRAEAMEKEIDDQLTECQYNAVCRDIIHDACLLGTGIVKGPMVEMRAKKAWIEDEAGNWVLDLREEHKPTSSRVDPWNFFPDMSAVKWEDCEFCFERHLMTQKQLRKLAKQPGFSEDRIRDVLRGSPNATSAKLSYLNELREMNGVTQIQHDSRYEVIEYHGPLDKSDLVSCGCIGVTEDDPLEEYEGTAWFSNGIVIKTALNHMDSQELPYNVLNWEKDETTPFGFGVPYRMRAPQRVMNASWRMVLDNAGLSTGPQLLINKNMIEPADGQWTLSPRKLWWLTSKDPNVRADYAMQAFNIDSKQQELTNIFEMAHRLADEETSVPQMQMGAQPGDTQQPAMLKTLGGTALWMSSNNIMMRKAVKNFDDDITVPFITRTYDWNMQFNPKKEIKGDYCVNARGTSVLLVREIASRNIEQFIAVANAIPGGTEEIEARPLLKSLAKSMQMPADDLMRSDDDATASEDQRAPPDIEMMKLQLQERIAQEESRRKLVELEAADRISQRSAEVEMSKLAVESQGKLREIQEKARIEKYKTDVGIKQFYQELKVKQESGQTANYGLESEAS